MNIALKLYKKYEKHTINANKIHTYQGGSLTLVMAMNDNCKQ